jgi:hypothetical protein
VHLFTMTLSSPRMVYKYIAAVGSATDQASYRGGPGFDPRSGHVGFCCGQSGTGGQVSSEHFGFPCKFSFHRLLYIDHLSSGAGTVGKTVADVPSGLGLLG